MRRLFVTPPDWHSLVFALAAAATVALVVAEIGARIVRTLIHRCIGGGQAAGLKSSIVRGPIRLVRLTLFVLLAIGLTPPALELAGAPLRRGLRLGQVAAWAMSGGLRLMLIAALAFVLVRVIALLVGRFEQEVSQNTNLEVLERAKRARTLGGLVQNVLTTLVVVVSSLMILREVGLDITPILTGAGILGLAVGFGAQTLVKDIISGFFMILENEVRIGDVVQIDTHAGMVEDMNLRTIVLRDVEGTVHIIPNGSVTAVMNRSKDFSFYVIDLPAPYDVDTDIVGALVRRVGAELRADLAFAPFILGDIEVLGVDAFADSSVIIKVRIKTVPLKQWEVGRELRRRLKKAYDAAGIAFPYPTQTHHMIGPPPDVTS
ncbi:MAG: mechanosensitive ion channel family protein [Acidobacteriota bacterium]|nr:mechanosensitive ion channel family protein [Acidobacteriota bacterium]